MTPDLFPEVVPTADPNRRYTTRTFMEFIKRVAEVDAWDLDPAADEESHWAPRWFAAPGDVAPGAAGVDGLRCSWRPTREWADGVDERRAECWRVTPQPANSYEHARTWRIFINPPFDLLAPWVDRVWRTLWEDDAVRDVDAKLVPSFCEHVEPYLAGHAYAGRFGYPGNPHGIGSSGVEWPSVVLVWRRIS